MQLYGHFFLLVLQFPNFDFVPPAKPFHSFINDKFDRFLIFEERNGPVLFCFEEWNVALRMDRQGKLARHSATGRGKLPSIHVHRH